MTDLAECPNERLWEVFVQDSRGSEQAEREGTDTNILTFGGRAGVGQYHGGDTAFDQCRNFARWITLPIQF